MRYLWRNRFHQVTELEEGGCADCCECCSELGNTESPKIVWLLKNEPPFLI